MVGEGCSMLGCGGSKRERVVNDGHEIVATIHLVAGVTHSLLLNHVVYSYGGVISDLLSG